MTEILLFNAFFDGKFNMLSYFHILFLKLLIYIQLLSSTTKNNRKEVCKMKITLATSSEFLTLAQLTKLHNANLDVCPAHTHFNVSNVDPRAKVHSKRKLELNKDDLLKFFNQKGYATYQVGFNRQNQPVQHLMPYSKNKATDFANLLKSQLTKYIKKQYPHYAGIVLHFDEATPHAHVFFADIDTTNTTTHSHQPEQKKRLKSNNTINNKQENQSVNNKQQVAYQRKQQQEQLQQLRQRQVQIAVNNANDELEKKKREKQRQARIQRQRQRRRLRKQQDDLEP